jgi:hypothetical protein
MYEDADHSEGPFDTREEALADAQKNVDDDAPANPHDPYTRHVSLGHVKPIVPEDHVHVLDLDWLLDAMNEDDDLHYMDDAGIEVKCDCPKRAEGPTYLPVGGHTCSKRAEDALHETLRTWAREYLVGTAWQMEEVEVVELEKR